MKDYEVVGYAYTDVIICTGCMGEVHEDGLPIFAGSSDAEVQCIACGDWLLGQEPDGIEQERRRLEEEAVEAELAQEEALKDAKRRQVIQDAEDEVRELEAMLERAKRRKQELDENGGKL